MLVVVNPKGGAGRAERVLERSGLAKEDLVLDIQYTRYPGHAADLVRAREFTNQDTVVVVGGDGTLHEVVNALMERDSVLRPALGLLPGGTGNSLAHDLDLVEIGHAREALLGARRHPLDLLRVRTSGRYFYAFNMVGYGLPATAGARAEAFRWLGPSRYTLASVIEILLARTPRVEFKIAGEIRSGAFPAVMICNTRHIGIGMQMASRAKLDDGLMDVVILEPATRVQILKLLRRVYAGAHVYDRKVTYHQCSEFSLEMPCSGLINLVPSMCCAGHEATGC